MRRNALLVLFVVSLLGLTAEAEADLQATAGCRHERIVIVNKDSAHWFDVKIEVNRRYRHETAVIAAGDTMRFFPGIFTTSNGTRLDLKATACQTIDLHATIRGERHHWNGTYK